MAVCSSVTVPHSIARGAVTPIRPAKPGRHALPLQRGNGGCRPESRAAVPSHRPPPEDGTVLFTEKLSPSAWIWLVAPGLAQAPILVLAPIRPAAVFPAAAVLFTILATL